MPSFSEKSKRRLKECHMDLQRVFFEVVKEFDCYVIEGHRGADRQNEMYELGRSKLIYPHSKHNHVPSLAVDVAAYPIDWNDRERATYFAGYVLGLASRLGVVLRWGGDWDRNWQVRDNVFDDLWHFELVKTPEGGDVV